MKLQPEIMRDLITKYDVISVRGRRYPRIKTEGKTMDVYHEYGMVPFQHRKDLDITLQILKEKYPAFAQTADSYMQSETIKTTVHGSLTSFLRQKSGSTVPGTAWKNTG